MQGNYNKNCSVDKNIEILGLHFDDDLEDKKQKTRANKLRLQKIAGLLRSRNIDPVQWQQSIRLEYER